MTQANADYRGGVGLAGDERAFGIGDGAEDARDSVVAECTAGGDPGGLAQTEMPPTVVTDGR
jgi:hypothetical protein